MKFTHEDKEYEVDFFYGKDGVPKDERDETTNAVRSKCKKSFLCEDCKFGDRDGKIGFTDEDFEGLG